MVRHMFGPRITTVFASRWRALWFSASVLLTAYCSIPHADDAKAGDTPSNSQEAASKKGSDGLTDAERAKAQAAIDALNKMNH